MNWEGRLETPTPGNSHTGPNNPSIVLFSYVSRVF